MLKLPLAASCFAALFISITPLLLSAQLPSGATASYQLNTNATDMGGNGYNGTLTAVSNTSNRFGSSNTAIAFTAGSSTGTLPVGLVTAMQNDFSLGFWFKTSMTANTSTAWYGGNALVDAEVCGQTDDWGTALINGGKVCFGVGNPDLTIISAAAGYNNGNWHFVTATRNKTAGAIILYVDGVSVASSTGANTGVLNAPTLIGLARNPCSPSGVYTGSLDDILIYNRVLSATEVSNMYVYLSALALPVKWISFTGAFTGNTIVLRWEVEKTTSNDHFEIENSTDGIHFSVEGSLPDKGAETTTASESYIFSGANPSNGTHFYRIKQVDKDGLFSYSKTLKIMVRNVISGLYLQTNPVADELVLLNRLQVMVQRIQVTDMQGRIISNRPINTSNTIITSTTHNLLPGYYLLRVITANGNFSMPLIKQ